MSDSKGFMAHQKDLRAAYTAWLGERELPASIAITVTFKPSEEGKRLSLAAAQDAIRVYCRLLNSRAYGNRSRRYQKRLTVIPVREGGCFPGQKHLHYHLQVEIPEGWTQDAWLAAAEVELRKIRLVSDSQVRLTPVQDKGWMSYMLKKRDKPSFHDAIDVANLWLNN